MGEYGWGVASLAANTVLMALPLIILRYISLNCAGLFSDEKGMPMNNTLSGPKTMIVSNLFETLWAIGVSVVASGLFA